VAATSALQSSPLQYGQQQESAQQLILTCIQCLVQSLWCILRTGHTGRVEDARLGGFQQLSQWHQHTATTDITPWSFLSM
jgi:hypothetical protein